MPENTLKRVPLHAEHAALGARMVPFAGYEMPVQYRGGVLREHLHTRASASVFDVSHMGQIELRPRSGNLMDAALGLEKLTPADVVSLEFGRQRYALFTVPGGGIFDDLMVVNLGDRYFLVVNAARKDEDLVLLREGIGEICDIEPLMDRALLAIQGPRAAEILSQYAPSVGGMKFMEAGRLSINGADCVISRSGYTGEDGFEISVPARNAVSIWQTLLENQEVQPAGLGARDSLRLEAGLCLYGNDIDLTTSPVEAGLEWSIQKSRRQAGVRVGGFPGADVILRQIESGETARKRVGLRPESRPARAAAALFAGENDADPIGHVTSGGFGPSVNGPVSMGYVPREFAQTGTRLYAEVGGERYPAIVHELPFVAHRYKR